MKKKFKIVFFIVVLFLASFLAYYGYTKLKNKIDINNTNNYIIYDKNDEQVFKGLNNNKWIELENISKNVVNATIYTEDKYFYKHLGFDIPRIIKAGYTNIKNGKTIQGASTISQQYIKNAFLDFDKTWKRKWNEMWLTINLEINYTKDEILEAYLNSINYGHGMYGIESAANFYFNKSAKDLTLAEATILVGIPKSPSNYSPLINYKKSKERQKIVLKSMLNNNIITEEDYEKAYNEKLNLIGKDNNNETQSIFYYKDAVIEELKTINNIPKNYINNQELKIYTSYDNIAQKALEDSSNKNIDDEKLQISAISMDPNNGEILAILGGKDYKKSQYNRVLNSKRQVGSTMKTLLYYAALENGFTASTNFTSEETTFTFSDKTTYTPKNANEIYANSPISLAAAISYSDNIYAIKTHMFLGEETLVNMSKRLGIKSNISSNPSLPLGTNEINIIEITAAYAAFANEGYKIEPHIIKKIEDKEGNVLFEYQESKELILNKNLVYILNELLTTTYSSSFINYNYPTIISIAPRMTRKYAVKSGTTATDLWTIGYTPQVITSVWIGYDNNKEINEKNYTLAKNVWIDSIETYLKNKEKVWYKKPNNVSGYMIDAITGKPATEDTKNKTIMYYLKGTEPTGNEMVFDEITD